MNESIFWKTFTKCSTEKKVLNELHKLPHLKIKENWIKPKVSKIKIKNRNKWNRKQRNNKDTSSKTKAGSLKRLIIDKPLDRLIRKRGSLLEIIEIFKG